jgi:hypothetical protein
VCEAWGRNSEGRERGGGEGEGGRERERGGGEGGREYLIIKVITHTNECKNSDLIYFGGD